MIADEGVVGWIESLFESAWREHRVFEKWGAACDYYRHQVQARPAYGMLYSFRDNHYPEDRDYTPDELENLYTPDLQVCVFSREICWNLYWEKMWDIRLIQFTDNCGCTEHG